jgi:hypothetical protein
VEARAALAGRLVPAAESRGIGRPNGVAVGAELVNLPAATGDESISESSGLR